MSHHAMNHPESVRPERRRVTGEHDHPRCRECHCGLPRDADYCDECEPGNRGETEVHGRSET